MDSKALLRWYRTNKRDLPWRGSCDPYTVLVSEFMLQQTQVATVIPYYGRFMGRFPTAAALAVASDQEVMANWAGLGYYRRARALHQCAQEISSSMPSCAAEWKELPGIGDYTAAAVASIAQGERVACVDGNVKRVFARQFALSSTESVSSLSVEAMGRANPGDWNQAVMELGALICTPKQPQCGSCPISTSCLAHSRGEEKMFPGAVAKPTALRLLHVCVCPTYRGKVGVRRIESGWWQGLWEFPRVAAKSAAQGLKALGFADATPLGSLRHTVTNNRIELKAYWVSRRVPQLKWVSPSELVDMPMPSPQRRVSQMLMKQVFAG